MIEADRQPLHHYLTFMGRGPKQVSHFEHWSCPDAESFLTGIDYYEAPRECRLRLREIYPELRLGIPESNLPIQRPSDSAYKEGDASTTRWGEGRSWHFDWGAKFKTLEDVLAFSPLEQGDFREIPVVESHDYRDEEALYRWLRSRFPEEWGSAAPTDQDSVLCFYNTMFMWPLLTFGWEWFLEASLEEEFDRLMEEFAELSLRMFRSIARCPANVVICHDDIVTARGPTCSPAWMAKHIFPRYEEFFGMLRASGKKVVFMVDGNMDAYVDDVFACGAQGIITEPYTDLRAVAARYPDCVIAGEGDNRILSRNDPAEIRAMVEFMAESAKRCGGYFMCIGNHIPWNIPPEAIKLYLDLSRDLAVR